MRFKHETEERVRISELSIYTTVASQVSSTDFTYPFFIAIWQDGLYHSDVTNQEEWDALLEALERETAWKPEKVLSASQMTPEERKQAVAARNSGKTEARTAFEQGFIDSEKDHIDPPHYKDFVPGLQWFEAEQYRASSPEAFLDMALSHSRKYQSRLGKKDAVEQELKKSLWYLKFAVAFAMNGYKPILVKDIDDILAGK
ncbi:MAG: hypothetical protein DRQ62_00120 [Gammaproteobacteria bacterium]|nr:MAG: hypothetical protein DRQ62_00120 [Gammaproteobacteria bacterium]